MTIAVLLNIGLRIPGSVGFPLLKELTLFLSSEVRLDDELLQGHPGYQGHQSTIDHRGWKNLLTQQENCAVGL